MKSKPGRIWIGNLSIRTPDGRRYLRLHIQAKRAISADNKYKHYWFYEHLDHAVPKGAYYGTQHQLLMKDAARPGCVPLYFFYHPQDALSPKTPQLPAIEGVNVMLANRIAEPPSQGAWPRDRKYVERWRPHFMPLSALLCFGRGPFVFPLPTGPGIAFWPSGTPGLVSPGELADRLNGLNREPGLELRAIENIPPQTERALYSEQSKHRAEVERPRVIFETRRP